VRRDGRIPPLSLELDPDRHSFMIRCHGGFKIKTKEIQ